LVHVPHLELVAVGASPARRTCPLSRRGRGKGQANPAARSCGA
jgi:hypothetical protein